VKPGYKQTEVGVIPEDWDVASIGTIASFKSGEGINVAALREQSSDTPIPVYGGNGIAGYTDRALVQHRVVVVGRVGQKCGEVYLSDGPSWVTDNALYPRTLFRKIDMGLLALALKGAGLNDVKNRNDLPLITQSILHLVRIPFPPTSTEQEAIAEALSDADALIVSLEQLLTKKRQLKQGAMQELLTGKKRLPGFIGELEMKRLGDVVDTDPENLGNDTNPNFAFNYIALEDVERGFLRGHSEQVFANAPSRARRKLRLNDVLVSTVRPNLQSHLLFRREGGNWVCSTGFCVVRCRKGVTHPGYVFFHLFANCVNRQIEALLTGSSYPAINSRDVRALEIPFPDYNEQAAIAAILSDMDAEIAALEAKLAKARHLKQGMMQELLTGHIRLIN